MRDFTYTKYAELLKTFLKNSYKIYTVEQYLKKKPKENFVILRHDVDRALSNALQLAKIEASLGIKSTYYFRTSTFKLPIVKQISEMGHEIGYHYEILFKAKGDYKLAIKLFEEELPNMRKHYPIKTICAHGNIFMKGINYDIWKKYDFKKYGLLGEAYLSLNKEIKSGIYFSDTGRQWNKVKTTDNLINLISSKKQNFYILARPDKWNNNLFSWGKMLILQKIKNFVKEILKNFGFAGGK